MRVRFIKISTGKNKKTNVVFKNLEMPDRQNNLKDYGNKI